MLALLSGAVVWATFSVVWAIAGPRGAAALLAFVFALHYVARHRAKGGA